MTKAETRILEMLLRVRQFLLSRINAFPANSRGRELHDAIHAAVGNMERYAATQAQHAHAIREKTAQKKLAYDALRKAVETISRTARSMSRLTPGLEEKFRLPSNRETQTWLATARAFVTEVDPLTVEFVRRGMAPDFIDDLKARILAVEQFQDGQAQRSAERVASTAAVAEAAAQGFDAVRELNAIVLNIYVGNEAELAAWESASRVERAPRRAEAEAPPAQPEPAPAGV